MADYLKDESKVGAMLRYMTGDVALSFKRVMEDLYNDPKKDPKICATCAKWHWLIAKYSKDPQLSRKYISIIEYAYEYEIDLETMESFKKTMRIVLPEEFIYKMSAFTQVPQIAVMDDSHAESRDQYKHEVRDYTKIDW